MKRVPAEPLNYEFSRHPEPRAEVEPGETILVEAEDALSGQIRTNDDRRDKSKMPYSNPVAGPIAVRGAKPGDSIAVTIHDIVPRDGRCATYTGHPKRLCEWLGTDVPHGAHVCPIEDGTIHFSDNITIPYAPMLGCIGTAPDWGCPHNRTCRAARREHGPRRSLPRQHRVSARLRRGGLSVFGRRACGNGAR